MVANQPTLWTTVSGLHAASAATTAITQAPRLATAHLLRPGVPEQLFDRGRLVGTGGDKDPEAIVCEPWIVEDRAHTTSRVQHVQQDAENRGQGAEENRHLEHDDDIGRK